ncbi:hypothetical protein Taro_014326 [Colocasia esculenta]|uniref:Uncharacterized protein n=1 Tax=Colocasia esculenta TaxID=4460 RepID=A0A843U8S0_COLES|nr:hypothetical protein [Colocasia esculenta]
MLNHSYIFVTTRPLGPLAGDPEGRAATHGSEDPEGYVLSSNNYNNLYIIQKGCITRPKQKHRYKKKGAVLKGHTPRTCKTQLSAHSGYKSSQRSLSLLLTTHGATAASATRPTPSSRDDEPLAERSRGTRPSWHRCQDTATKVLPSVTERREATNRVPYQKGVSLANKAQQGLPVPHRQEQQELRKQETTLENCKARNTYNMVLLSSGREQYNATTTNQASERHARTLKRGRRPTKARTNG